MQIRNRIETVMLMACVESLQHESRRRVHPKVVFKDVDVPKEQLELPKTFIMRWNPEISNHKIADFEDSMECFFDHDFYYDWRIYDYKDAKVGDRFYMLKVGNGNTGIVMYGTIVSQPYKDKDWSGQGRDVRYVRMNPECMIHPNKSQMMITTQMLTKAIPDFNWLQGHSGEKLNEQQATMLNTLWNQHFAENHEKL